MTHDARPGRRLALMLAVVLATTIAGDAAARKRKTPPPPPPPAVSLSPRVIEQASAYRRYVDKMAAVPAGFTDGASVAQALRAGTAYEPQQLLRGAIAYGAVIALQDPTFVAGVRTYVNDPTQRRQVAYEIMKDPAYAVGFAGSSSAAGLVMNAIGGDGQKLLDRGRLVRQAAYDVQRSPWSKAEVQERTGRLAAARLASGASYPGDPAEVSLLQQAATGAAPMSLAPRTARPPYPATVVRALAVAALAALGYADDASLAQVMPILAETNTGACLNMSKLNLYQCLAVAKPHYEDVFCMGQHVLMDTGMCLMRAGGAPLPLELKTRPLDVAKFTAYRPKKAPAKKRAKH